MGEAKRKRAELPAFLDDLAARIRASHLRLDQVVQELVLRGITMGEPRRELPPLPADCPGCNFARKVNKDLGEVGDLILRALHAQHAVSAPGSAAPALPPALPLSVLPALALAKGLAITQVGPWRVVLCHLEGLFILSIRMEASRSTRADWGQLGSIVAQIGAPGSPLVPIENLPPDHAITWRWPAPVAPGGLAAEPADAN